MVVTSPTEGVAIALILAGGVFFFAGLVGLLRFPDVYARIHAVTKADTLGLGLVAVGIALVQPSPVHAARVLLDHAARTLENRRRNVGDRLRVIELEATRLAPLGEQRGGEQQ